VPSWGIVKTCRSSPVCSTVCQSSQAQDKPGDRIHFTRVPVDEGDDTGLMNADADHA